MIAIDANVVLRYLLHDDAVQSPLAVDLIDGDDVVFIAVTVIMEVSWMLTVSGYAKEDILTALNDLAGQSNVRLQAPYLVADALDNAKNGLDIADALHWGLLDLDDDARRIQSFATFDKAFVKRGQKLKLKPPLRDLGRVS